MGEGLAIGLDNERTNVLSSMKRLAEFNPEDLRFDVSEVISRRFKEQDNYSNIDINNRQPIQLLIQIDGENIPFSVSKITEAINNVSFLKNSGIINI